MQQYLFLPLPVEGVLSDSLQITGTAPYVLRSAASSSHFQPIEIEGVEFSVSQNVQVDALLAFDSQHTRWQPGTRIEAAIFERDAIRQVSPVAVFETAGEASMSYCELRLGRTWLTAGEYTVLAISSHQSSVAGEQQMALTSDPEQEGLLYAPHPHRATTLSRMAFTRRENANPSIMRPLPHWPRR